MDFSSIKKHPYVTASVGIVGVIVLYLILKSHSSSASGGTSPDLSSENALTQVQAASSVALAQSGTAANIAELNAQVATTQVNAQLEAVKSSNATALSIVQTQSAEHVQENADSVGGSVAIANENATAAEAIAQTQSNTVLGIAATQADVQKTQISSLSDATRFLANKGYNAQKITNIVSALEGPQAIAANQPSSVSAQQGENANSPAGFLSILNPTKLLSTFFG